MPMYFALSRNCWERGCILPLEKPMVSCGSPSISPPSVYVRLDSASVDRLLGRPAVAILFPVMLFYPAGSHGDRPDAVTSHQSLDEFTLVRSRVFFLLA